MPDPHTADINCVICGEPIVPGEQREPTAAGVQHVACRRASVPDSVLGRIAPTDAIELEVDGEWWTATVEGVVSPPRKHVVRMVFADGFPNGWATDQFDVTVAQQSEDEWTDPELYEIIPDEAAMAAADDLLFRYRTRPHGTTTVRQPS